MYEPSIIRKRLKQIYFKRLCNNHCKPWKLEHLFIQRSLVRNNMKRLGAQLSKELSNQWTLSIVRLWSKPKIINDQVSKELIDQFERYGLREACTIVRSFILVIPLNYWFHNNVGFSLPY